MFWLIEKSGDSRQIFGPYPTLASAQREKGKRYAVVQGSEMANGHTMTRGELNSALASGRIYVVDGSDKYALA